MKAARRHAASLQTPPQLPREQYVRELGLAIAGKAAVEAFGVQVIEGDVRALVGFGRSGDDTGGSARLQPIEEQIGEQERC